LPGASVIAGDEDAPAMAVVFDLVPHPNASIVHLNVPSQFDRRVPGTGTTG
jgi:hypothetical protein